jgi:tetratricopeptide (TPR) repeat protein/DNA-binding CsgD family transcriptional regulator
MLSGNILAGPQSPETESRQQGAVKTTDKERLRSLLLVAEELSTTNTDSSLALSAEALQLADSLHLAEYAASANYYIGLAYLKQQQLKPASAYLTRSLQYAELEDDFKLHIKNLIGLAEIHSQKIYHDSAIFLLEKAENLALNHNYHTPIANIYNNMALIYKKEGNLTAAIEGYLKAAESFNELNRPDAVATVYGNISGVYYDLKNYQDALQYLKMSLEINKKENLTDGIYKNYNNLGMLYSEIDSVEKALYYYKLVIENARSNGNEHNLAKGYLNLANLLNKEGIYEQAGSYYDSSIYFSEKNNIIFGIMIGKMNLGNYYNNIGDYQSSLKTLREVQKLLSRYNLPSMEATVSAWISKAFKGTGVYDSALYYFELYEHINDSISGIKTRETVLELEKKYQSERKAREIAELQQSVSAEKSRSRLFISALIFVAIMFVLTGFLLTYRRHVAILRAKLISSENETLRNTMELRNQELVSKALMVSNLNEQLEKINGHVQQIKTSLDPETTRKLDIMVKDLEITLPDHAWQEFETRFEMVHQGFFNRLLEQYPGLTPTELKICSLLRLNMSTKDIALLTNRSIGTVDNIRSSIRKKLNLDADANLTCFLLNF